VKFKFTVFDSIKKGKDKVVPVCTVEAYWECEGVAHLSLHCGTRCKLVVSFYALTALHLVKEAPAPTDRKLVGP